MTKTGAQAKDAFLTRKTPEGRVSTESWDILLSDLAALLEAIMRQFAGLD